MDNNRIFDASTPERARASMDANNIQPIPGRPGMAYARRWFDTWMRVHVYAWLLLVDVFMFIFAAVERMNDSIFELFIRMAMARARRHESIHQAVARGDIRKVSKLVRRGTSLSEPDATGRTALHVALERLEEAVMEEELDESEYSEEEEDAPKPAGTAAPTTTAMARRGANETTRRAAAETVRGQQSSAEWFALVRLLLEHQTDVNAADAQCRAPIHLAVKAGLHEVAQRLIEAGADPTLLAKGASTTLHQAAIRRDTRMIALLLDAAKKKASATDGGGSLDLFVNGMGRDGWSALGLAARAGDVIIVKALLDAGADRAATMKNGKTALELARLNKKSAVVKLLE